jgi:hypothetical protein
MTNTTKTVAEGMTVFVTGDKQFDGIPFVVESVQVTCALVRSLYGARTLFIEMARLVSAGVR